MISTNFLGYGNMTFVTLTTVILLTSVHLQILHPILNSLQVDIRCKHVFTEIKGGACHLDKLLQ